MAAEEIVECSLRERVVPERLLLESNLPPGRDWNDHEGPPARMEIIIAPHGESADIELGTAGRQAPDAHDPWEAPATASARGMR
jgi:hypothetical protein